LFDRTIYAPPFTIRVRSGLTSVADHVEHYYGALPVPAKSFIDFDIQVLSAAGPRRYLRPQANFVIDGQSPFLPLPENQAAALFEWGLNWAIATRPLGYLVMHAAVLARNDEAVVMPGFPGAGKSTLCAALAWLNGWRLLSDELAILDPNDVMLQPNPRPISLKNTSIDVVAGFPGVRLGPRYLDTRKGTLCHASVPADSMTATARKATCRWVVFPRFTAGAEPSHAILTHAEAFALISEQSFNKERMGEPGFVALCTMLDAATCHEIEYGTAEDGLRLIEEICRA